MLLDRFGSKRLMLTGLLLMSAGQLWFAFAGSFSVGLAARVMLGAGDAMVFTSLLRLVAVWFRVKQAPFVTQLTGMVGQLGAVAAATPLAAALATWGWTASFATAAGMGLLLSVALVIVVKDSPYRGEAVERRPPRTGRGGDAGRASRRRPARTAAVGGVATIFWTCAAIMGCGSWINRSAAVAAENKEKS